MSGTFADYTGAALQLLLGAVFLLAAAGKVRNPVRLEHAIRGYNLIPLVLSAPAAGALLVGEAFVALSLLSGWALAVGLPAAGGLLVTFAFAVGINLSRGRKVPCGCFGSDVESISGRTLARLGMLILGVVVVGAVRLLGTAAPMSVETFVADGTGALQRLVFTAAFAAFFAVSAMWALHLPEMRTVIRRSLD